MNTVLWGENINTDNLSPEIIEYINSLPQEIPPVEWIWQEMDRVWKKYNLNNKLPLQNQKIANFYSHPVWLVNGIFTANDTDSITHRKSIKKYLVKNKIKYVADYGGGSGVLANILAEDNSIKVDIIEPYPSKYYITKYKENLNIEYLKSFRSNNYECIIAQDVLEHVENPIDLAFNMAKHVKDNGYLIFANCFYPVIECHLPKTFYLRYTFPLVMTAMGLKYIGKIEGAEHALVFQKMTKISLKNAKRVAFLAEKVSPILPLVAKIKRKIV